MGVYVEKRIEVYKVKYSERDQYIIKQYEHDEEMMILMYAQWCVNHELDARSLYEKAYPHQPLNKALLDAMEHTVPKEESEEISQELVVQILQLFGNDDLAYEVQHAIKK